MSSSTLLKVLLVVIAIPLASCRVPPGPVRHTPTAKLGGRLAWQARRLDVLGLTPRSTHSTGPNTTGDIMRGFSSSEKPQAPDGSGERSADQLWFDSYIESYRDDIDDQWDETREGNHTVFEPIEEAQLRVVAVDETVRFYNEQGRTFENGFNMYLSNRSWARLFDRFVITAEPELSVVEFEDVPEEDTQTILRFQELTLSSRLGPVELTTGRQPLWWGPGRHGSLLLTNNARPFDLVKVSTSGPVLLPWYFSYLGLIQAEIFATRLQSARAVSRPYMGGIRLESRVLPWLELGLSRTAQFGGGDRSLTGRTLWEVLTASTENDDDDPGNQIASIDARVIVPVSAQPFEVYGEFGGEDEAGGFFSRNAYMAGFYLPRIGPWHLFELTFEYADTLVPGHSQVWYNNRNFPDGYTYHDRIIGHHVGTDGRDFYTELRFHPPIAVSRQPTLILSHNYEEHRPQERAEERLQQFRAAVEINATQQLVLSGFFQTDLWQNFRQNRGLDEAGHAVGLGARLRF